jgi:TP901 family phage tail tape measure protein
MTTLDVALRLRLISALGGAAGAKKELQGIADAAKRLGGAKADRLARDLARTKTEAKGAEGALQKVAAGAKRLDGSRADKLARDLGRVRGEATTGERAVYRLGQSVRRLDGTGAERLARGLRQAASAAKDAGRAVEQLKHTAPAHGGGSVGAGAVGAGALIAGAGASWVTGIGAAYAARRVVGAGLGTAIEQEKAWAEVQKKVDGSPEQLIALQTRLRALAIKYGMSIPEIFNQAAEAGAANVPIGEIEDFIKLTTKSSIGWDMEARRTAQVLAKTKTGKQYTPAQLEALANKINMVANKTAAAERDVAEMYGRAGESGAIAGFSEDDSLAILAGANAAGMEPEVTARWFGAFSSKLAGAHAGSKGAKQGWKMLGLDPTAIAKGMEQDALGTMQKVYGAIEKAPQMKKVAALSAIFGEGWWDESARVGKAIPEILRLRQLLADPKNYAGSLDANLNIQLATWSG